MRLVGVYALALIACNSPAPAPAPVSAHVPGTISQPGDVVMVVDGAEVGVNETTTVFRRMGIPSDQIEPLMKTPLGRHVLEDYALATKLYNMAIEQDLHKDPDVQLQVAFSERQALSQAMRAKLARESVADGAVQGWLDTNAMRLNMPQIRGRMIVTAKESTARELLERVQNGEDFAALAKVHSIDPATQPVDGDMGWFTAGDYPELGQALFSHINTKLLGPIQGRAGFHLVEILDRREKTPDAEARMMAVSILEKEAAVEAVGALRKELKVDWKIEMPSGHKPEGHPETPAVDPAAAPAEEAPTAGDHG